MALLSSAICRIQPSPTIAVTRKAAELKAAGRDIISLSAGEPDFDAPDSAKKAMIDAIRANKTHYTAVDGTPDLKDAIRAKFARDNGLSYERENITVNVGGKQTIFNALLATLDPGDEVIIPTPCWVSYPDIVAYTGAKAILVPASVQAHFKITPDQLERAITPQTKWLILNSPSNPTGAAYDEEEIRELGRVLLRHPHVWVLTDDIYEHIVYDGFRHVTIAQAVPELQDRTLTMNGVSKAYAMTGLRIGFAGGPAPLIRAIAKIQSQSTSNPCSIAQAGALAALNGPQDFLAKRAAIFQKRRDLIVDMLNAVPGLSCPTPQGAFYAYPDCSELIGKTTPAGNTLINDETVAQYLLEEAEVAVVHGGAFWGSPAFRVSYACADNLLQEAGQRIQKACAALS